MKKISFILVFASLSNNSFALELKSPIIISDGSNKALENSSSNVEVIGQDEIKRYQNLSEILKFESSLYVTSSGAKGGMGSVFIRGTDSSHIVFVIDGVIANDPSNPNRMFDFGKMSAANIEKIEILKGSQSLLYGANAIGGVIYITTKKIEKSKNINLSYEHSSLDTHNATIFTGLKNENIAIDIGSDFQKSRGHSSAFDTSKPNDDDGNKKINVYGKLTQFYNKDNYSQIDIKHFNSKDELDKGSFNDDPNDFIYSRETYFNYRYYQNNDSSKSWFDISSLSNARSLHILFDQYDSTDKIEFTKAYSKTASFNHQKYFSDLFTTLFKVEYKNEDMKINRGPRFENENLSFIVNNEFNYNKHDINFGIRIDHNDIFSNFVNGKISYLYAFEKFNFKFNTASGVKTPSLYQLFDATYGNKDLRPEKSISGDIGIDYFLNDHSKLSLSIFDTYLYDRHSYDTQSFISINEGNGNIYGSEINYANNLLDNLTIDFSYTYLKTKDSKTDLEFLRRPKHSFASKMMYSIQNHNFQLNSKWVSSRFDYNANYEREKLEDFLIFDLFYDYQLNKNWALKAKAQNLFNKKYQEIMGLNSLSRSFSVGFNMNY